MSWENVCIAKNGPYLKLDQILIAQIDHVVVKSAKPYLATLRTYTLITLIYKKSKSGDITHDFSKVE